MSAVLTRPPAAIYREEQNFAWWVYVALGAVLLLATSFLPGATSIPNPSAPLGLDWLSSRAPMVYLMAVGMPLALSLCLLHMTIEVGPERCEVTFGWIPVQRRTIALGEIRTVEIVTYRALRDHLFWGVRTLPDGERVMTARGNKAVRLHLADGSRLLIGTQRPEELARILSAARPGLA